MRPSRTITLFAPPPPPLRRESSAIVASVLVHGLVFGCLLFGVRTAPRVSNRSAIRHYTVRMLNVPMTETPVEQAGISAPPRPAAKSAAATAPAPAPRPAPGASPASMPAVAVQLAQLVHKSQVLIQPDAPPDILLQHPAPIPLLLRWTPPDIPVKVITLAPPTQKSIVAKLRPSIEPPNRELNPADFKMSSTNLATALPSLPATTTSPIVVRGPETAPRRIPETASRQVDQPAPAQIMSFSDLQSQQELVAIPPANSPGRPVVAASSTVGPAVNSGEGGHGNPESKQSGNGTGPSPAPSEAKAGSGSGAAPQTAANAGPPQPSGSGLIDGGPGTSVTRLHLNKDGQFGVVVVGSSLAEQYPETVGLWGGRLVYTVYLHLGKGKAWILQYAVPPAALAASGNAGRPEAPWPYDIVQPHLDPNDYTSDAVMIHGFVNLAGRFERLAVVFPTEFAKAKFLLSALEQWQFRPARQNGQLAPVEVLLIIPEETE